MIRWELYPWERRRLKKLTPSHLLVAASKGGKDIASWLLSVGLLCLVAWPIIALTFAWFE